VVKYHPAFFNFVEMLILPDQFKTRIAANPRLGEELIQALQATTPIAVRMNPSKNIDPIWEVMEEIPWCPNGYYLNHRPSYVRDPMFHAGVYYPQESGSMSIDWVVRQLSLPDEPVLLDLCAAPGGKSTILISFLNGKGTLLANEIIPSRANILLENCTKWGGKNVLVTQNDPSDFQTLPSVFDLILVDAPCSGEGMFRKDPKAIEQWTPESHRFCATRQHKILDSILPCLKKDGYLIYSTCTFHEAENEDQVQRLLTEYDMELVEVALPEGAILGKDGLGFYCLPSYMKTEGFYCAVLKNRKANDSARKPIKKDHHKKVNAKISSLFDRVEAREEFLYQWRENWHQLNQKTYDILPLVLTHLHLRKMGTCLGNDLGKGWIPTVDLALDPSMEHHYPRVEVEKELALNYLRGETFSLSLASGFWIITYQGIPLGFIKVIGNRFNNLYPKTWRIRMRL
jgi:16S rRNA C967 or C1407 C5-methylase (RsmB/RsmF family)/NOL1/NOP2/fmu family ribosome biogenesis protein